MKKRHDIVIEDASNWRNETLDQSMTTSPRPLSPFTLQRSRSTRQQP